MARKKTIEKPDSKLFAVFAPFLGGYYLGQLLGYIRDLSVKENFNIVAVRTKTVNEFNIPVAFNNLDGIITLTNSLSPVLAETALEMKIPIVSIGYNYDPLPIDAITCDNHGGVFAALEHLYKLGHRKIGFLGDLSVYDISRRFEAYQDFCSLHDLEIRDDYIFNAGDVYLQAGIQMANIFMEKKPDCTAVFCSTDLNAIGFIDRLQTERVRIPDQLAVVSFDSISMCSVRKPPITSVSQNLNMMAEAAVKRLYHQIQHGQGGAIEIKVPCSLDVRASCGEKDYSGKTEPENTKNEERLIRLHESVSSFDYEATKSIIRSHLDSIMGQSALFGPYLQWACLARWIVSDGEEKLNIQKIFTNSNRESRKLERLPKELAVEDFPWKDVPSSRKSGSSMATIIPIEVEQQKWGFLAVVGSTRAEGEYASYITMTNYLDLLSFGMEREVLIEQIRSREQDTKNLAEQLQVVSNNSTDGIWDWDLRKNSIEWNSRALNMLGFTTRTDQTAFRNMPFMEWIHIADLPGVRKTLTAHLETGRKFQCEFRIKNNSGTYTWVSASGEALKDQEDRPYRIIGSVADITERHRHEERIRYMAYHDTLTGLPNRLMIKEQLDRFIAEKPDNSLAILLLDLDRFKYINDSYGHDAGDRLLKHVSLSIRNVLRQKDFFARFGGDEFVFICPLDHKGESLRIGSRILKQLRQPYRDPKGFEFYLTGSLGISEYPKDGRISEDLLSRADIAMYHAKRTGKNRIQTFESHMNKSIVERIKLENMLRKAIDNHDITLVYQPQYRLEDKELAGFEALARWTTEEYGTIPPDNFVTLAEETDLIVPLGDLVLMEACRQTKEWISSFQKQVTVSVNVSIGQIMRGNLVGSIRSVLEKTGLPPRYLRVEITESIAISDIDQTKEILLMLNEMGVSVSLDDFGTGYSSLSILDELPLQEVKIDRSFMTKIENSEEGISILQAIINMGQALGYRTVIEGVETDTQMDILKKLGCDYLQGNLLCEPLPADDFYKRVLKGKG